MGNENENKQNESRWFLIEHECGSILTIKSDKYKNESQQQSLLLVCPSCPNSTNISEEIAKKLSGFLNKYKELTKFLKNRDFSIREIQPEELEAMKSPYRLSR